MRPICVKCKREMQPIQNDYLVKDKATDKFPSTFRFGDLYRCPICKNQIVTGFGNPLKLDIDEEPRDEALEFTR